MLNIEQERKLDRATEKYYTRMVATHKTDKKIIKAWSIRYRIAMEQALKNQCKR